MAQSGPLRDLVRRMLGPDPTLRPTMAQVAQELSRLSSVQSEPAASRYVGQVLGSYRIVGQIGAGGMGEVFEAQHTRLSRRAAIKLLRAEMSLRPDMVRRFFTEAESVNVVQHPGIVSIFEFGQLPDQTVFIVMEYLGGESLALRLNRVGRLGLDSLRLMRQIASALVAAHAHGVVHRDLKPENIMIVADPDVPGGERTKLLDFGIAKMAAETQAAGLAQGTTAAGIMMGTPAYMSPEQIRDTGSVNDRADVYSLGVLLFQTLGGQLPFSAPSFYELAAMHFNNTPPSLRELDPDLPEALCTLVHRMLAKEPADRPAMREVAQLLDEMMEPAKPAPAASPRWPVLVGLPAVAVAGIGLVFLLHRSPAPHPGQPALISPAAARDMRPEVNLAGLREQSLAVLQQGLHDAEPAMRRRALTLLWQSRDVQIAPLGAALLQDQDPSVRSQAAEALWQLGARDAVPALLEAIRERGLDDALKVELAGALLNLGEPEGERVLHRALRAQEEPLRDRAALYLAARGDKKGRQLLLTSRLEDDQVAALGRLARFGDQEAAAVLQRNLAPPDGAAPGELQVRIAEELARNEDEKARAVLEGLAREAGPLKLKAARILAQLDDPSFYDLFSQRFRDQAAPLPERMVAAEGLGASGRRSGAGVLGEALPADLGNALRLRLAAAGGILQIVASDPEFLSRQGLFRFRQLLADRSADERAIAASALADAEPGVAVPLLAQVAKDPEAQVRQRAARALGSTGVREAVPVLSGVLDDRVEGVRREAIASIGQLGERLRQHGEPVDDVVKSVAGHAEQGDAQERVASAAALARLGDESHRGALVGWLADRSFPVRFAAAIALARQGSKQGVPVLREGLEQHPGADALLARGWLLRLGETVPGAPAFVPGTEAERVAQVQAAGQLPLREALALLWQAVRDAAASVRLTVVEVLGGNVELQESAQGRKILRGLLSDPEPAVRAHAGLLYGRLGPETQKKPEATGPGEPPPAPLAADMAVAVPDLGTRADEAQRGHLQIEAEAEVRFQVDRRAPQVAPSKAVPVSPGKHRISYAGGVIEVEVPAGETVPVRVPVTQAEQVLADGVEAFKSGDLSRAQQLLQRARGQTKGKWTKGQWYELYYYQGRIHEEKGHWVDAMAEYEKLQDQIPDGRQTAEQRAELKEAVDRTASHLGRVQVSEQVDGVCQTKTLWLPPGSHVLGVGDNSKEIRVRAGETLKVQLCPGQ